MLASSRLAVVAARRSFSTGAETTIQLNAGAFNSFECNGPTMTETTVSNDDMIRWYKDMFTIRRMEIASDTMYKQREIRGFCHLYDGQEAVAVGMEAACTLEDHFVTAYRDHAHQYCRGDTVKSIMAELTGKFAGCSKGKGGSMHMYKEDANFYGGNGIVGAQIPVGAGLALAIKYKKTPDAMAVALYGDGASNQGQFFEALNMAALWKLPFIALCENNNFAMGTSTARHAAMDEFYKRGNACAVPGLRVDGMDLLAVNEATKWAKDYVTTGNGPLVMEMMTYRYHGHSMSDPGITYRSRDDVNEVRKTRDPIELQKQRILDNGIATKEEVKAIEKVIRAHVQEAMDFALSAEVPPDAELYTDIYDAEGYAANGPIRTVELANSVTVKQ
jgi:pyruvate dehydrogenase E1 component alpha subunit